MVGKYVEIGEYELTDSYISVNQSLEHAGASHDAEVAISWIDSRRLEAGEVENALQDFDGIIVPGAFGEGGADGVLQALPGARAVAAGSCTHWPCRARGAVPRPRSIAPRARSQPSAW